MFFLLNLTTILNLNKKLHEQLKNFEYLIFQLFNDEINLNNIIEKRRS